MNYSKRNKKILLIIIIASLLFLLGNFIDPTNVYEKKWIENVTDIRGSENEWLGTFMVQGLYKSQGVISSNHPVEIYIYQVKYYIKKESFKYSIGKDGIWPNNINVSLCLENGMVSGDGNFVKPYCIDLTLNKSEDELEFIRYEYPYYGYNPQKVVQFLTSGKQSLIVTSKFRSPIIIENAFEIEPSLTNMELQLNRLVLWLSIITLMGVIVQTIDWIGFLKP